MLCKTKQFFYSCLQEGRTDRYLPGWSCAGKYRNWNSWNSQETVSVILRVNWNWIRKCRNSWNPLVQTYTADVTQLFL